MISFDLTGQCSPAWQSVGTGSVHTSVYHFFFFFFYLAVLTYTAVSRYRISTCLLVHHFILPVWQLQEQALHTLVCKSFHFTYLSILTCMVVCRKGCTFLLVNHIISVYLSVPPVWQFAGTGSVYMLVNETCHLTFTDWYVPQADLPSQGCSVNISTFIRMSRKQIWSTGMLMKQICSHWDIQNFNLQNLNFTGMFYKHAWVHCKVQYAGLHFLLPHWRSG